MIVTDNDFLLSQQAASPSLNYPRILWDSKTLDLLPEAVSASVESEDAPADSVLRPNTDEVWSPPSLPATLMIDFGQAHTFNAVGIAGHNFSSSGASVRINISTDPSFPSGSVFATDIYPEDDSPLLFLDDDTVGRYLLVSLYGSAAPSMAVVYAGQALVMEKMVSGPYAPISRSRKTVLTRSLSRGGQFLGQRFRRNGVESSASFKMLSAAWVKQYFDPFARHARSLPYFFAWNPLEYPHDVGYVWSDKDITPRYSGFSDLMDVVLEMQGIGNR